MTTIPALEVCNILFNERVTGNRNLLQLAERLNEFTDDTIRGVVTRRH